MTAVWLLWSTSGSRNHEADDSLTLLFPADAVEDGTISVELTGSWVAGVDLEGISPQPSEERAIPGGIVLDVAVGQPGVTEILITFRAQEYGNLDAAVAVRGDTVDFTLLVLP